MQLSLLDDAKNPENADKTTAAPKAETATNNQPPDLFSDLSESLPPGKKTEKSPTALKTISEAAHQLGVEQHVLRFWESKFLQIKPMKMGGGRRYYRPEDMDIIARIQDLLHKQGYTIEGAKKALRIKTKEIADTDYEQESGGNRKKSELTDKQRKQVKALHQELVKLRESLQARLAVAL